MIQAVIFDMDGVLIDSEMEYIRLWKKFYDEHGVPVEIEELLFLAGSPHHYEEELLSRKMNLDHETSVRIKHAYFDSNPLDYAKLKKDGVDEVLSYLKNKGIVIALASSSDMDNIETVLSQCSIKDYFTLILSGEMFVKTKPDPEIYTTAVSHLGISKDKILVIEDSNYGIEAAKRAGLTVAALIDPLLNFDNELADMKITSLKEIERIIEEIE